MPGPKPARCNFPDDFVQAAIDAIHRRTVAVQDVQRYRLALLFQKQPLIASKEAALRIGMSARQVQRWRSRWAAGDFSIEDYPGRGRKASFSPSGSRLDSGDGLRSRRRNETTPQSTIAERSGGAGQRNSG